MPKKSSLKQWLVQFVKFNLVGLLNTLIDNGLYALFHDVWAWPFALAKTLSYGAGMVNSWAWNSRWTFARKGEKSAVQQGKKTAQILKFLLVNGLAYLTQLGILWLCERIWGDTSVWTSLFLATPASILVNFLGNKLFVFNKDSGSSDKQ